MDLVGSSIQVILEQSRLLDADTFFFIVPLSLGWSVAIPISMTCVSFFSLHWLDIRCPFFKFIPALPYAFPGFLLVFFNMLT